MDSLIKSTISHGGFVHPNIIFSEHSPSKNAGTVHNEIDYETNKGMGIYATDNIPKSTLLISVPFKLCISVELITSPSSPIKELFEENPGLLEYHDEVLAIALMYARLEMIKLDGSIPSEPTCQWLLHVTSLPTNFNSTIYWSEEELLELKDCSVYHLTKLMKNQIVHDFNTLHLPIAEQYPEFLDGITLEMYTWALSIVYSRSLELTRNNVHTRCLMPVLDMANHDPFLAASPTDTFQYSDENDSLSLVNPDDLSLGDECNAVYGNYPNGKLIFTYGFVVLNNPIRAVDVWTRITPSVYEYETKQRLLLENELTKVQTYDFKGTIRENYISPALLATIRVIQADEDELKNIDRAFKGQMISLRNEAATYVSLRNLLVARMKVENAESDRQNLGEMLLNNTDYSNRLLCALIVRVDERDLLQEAVTLVNNWIQSLNLLGDEYQPPDCRVLK
eukprot:gene5618-7760_t